MGISWVLNRWRSGLVVSPCFNHGLYTYHQNWNDPNPNWLIRVFWDGLKLPTSEFWCCVIGSVFICLAARVTFVLINEDIPSILDEPGWMKVGYRFKPATLGYLKSSRPWETLMDCSMAGWLMDSEGWILWIRWSLLCWDDFAGNFPTLQRVIEFWSNLHVGWKIPPVIVGSILISEPTNWLSSSILQRSASNEWNFSTTYLKLSIFARPPRTTGRTWRIFQAYAC